MEELKLEYGLETEKLVGYITENLSIDQLKKIEIKRVFDDASGVGCEPLTVSAILTLTPIITIAVTRLIERWIEARKQERQIKLLIETPGVSDEALKILAEIVKNNSNVSVSSGYTKKEDIQ